MLVEHNFFFPLFYCNAILLVCYLVFKSQISVYPLNQQKLWKKILIVQQLFLDFWLRLIHYIIYIHKSNENNYIFMILILNTGSSQVMYVQLNSNLRYKWAAYKKMLPFSDLTKHWSCALLSGTIVTVCFYFKTFLVVFSGSWKHCVVSRLYWFAKGQCHLPFLLIGSPFVSRCSNLNTNLD